MALISETINNIEHKTQLLVEKFKQLEYENEQLVVQNKELTEQNRTFQTDLLLKKSEISHLKKRKIAQEDEGSEELEQKKDLRTEIDQYILEIDKCIEWLQTQ